MKKIQLNSKERKLNSLVELVGQEVSVDNENEIIESEVESIKVTNDEVTLNLESGDEVVMDTMDAEELTQTGEVAMEVETEPQEFEVTREVLDEDGNPVTVTSVIEAPTEDEAIEVIKTIDSKRKRNSRNYKAKNSKQVNAKINPFTIYIGEDEFEINDAESQGDCEYVGADSFGDISEDPKVCKALCDGNVVSLRWNNMADYENGVTPQIQYNHRLNSRKQNQMPETKQFQLSIGDDYIARFTTCPMGKLMKLEIKKSDETNDKYVEVETSWEGKEVTLNDAFDVAKEAIEKLENK